MKNKSFNVPIYNFKVNFIEVEGKEDSERLCAFLRKVGMTPDIIEEIKEEVETESRNGGWTLANLGRKYIIIVILPTDSERVRKRVISHEKRHCEDDILRHCGVDDQEAAGYLAGFLGENIY